MRVMNLRNSNKKKVRGVKRKCNKMVKYVNGLTEFFPEANLDFGYWHLHLPVAQEFIDSIKTPHPVRRLCIQLLIIRAKHLIDIKPELDINIRVVACIQLPNLWNSQIIVFFGESYFESFFDRNNECQKWILLDSNRNISKELKVDVPSGLDVKGYREEIIDDDNKSISELWFIGELN